MKTALKFIAVIPLSYLGGNVIFGVLGAGSWLPLLMMLVLKPGVAAIVFAIFLWLTRFVVFVVLLFVWVFDE